MGGCDSKWKWEEYLCHQKHVNRNKITRVKLVLNNGVGYDLE